MIFVFEALTSRPHVLQYTSSKAGVLPKIAISSAKSKKTKTKSSINNPLCILSCKTTPNLLEKEKLKPVTLSPLVLIQLNTKKQQQKTEKKFYNV